MCTTPSAQQQLQLQQHCHVDTTTTTTTTATAAASPCAIATSTSAARAAAASPPAPPAPRTYYQLSHPYDVRCRLSAQMRARYAGYIPIIFEPQEQCIAHGNNSRQVCSSSGAHEQHGRLQSSSVSSSGCAAHGSDAEGSVRERGGDNRRDGSATDAVSELTKRLQSWWCGVDNNNNNSNSCSSSHRCAHGGHRQDISAATAQLRPQQQGELKFMMPARKTLSEVILTLRERLVLPPHQAVFLTVGEADVLAPGSSQLGDLYARYRHGDGFLYITYALENTFG